MNVKGKKKVLFMIDTLGGGGAERVLCHILKDLDRSKFELCLLLIIRDGVYLKDIPQDVPCSWIFNGTDSMRFPLMKYIYRLYRRVTLELFRVFPSLLSLMSGIKETYDIGVSFCEGHNTPLLSLKKHYFKKTIAWVHVDVRTHKANIRPDDLRKYSLEVNQLFFVSNDALKGFIERFPEFEYQQEKMQVIYNPIDIDDVIQKSKTSDLTIQKEKLTLLSVGRLTVQKRFDRLLEAHRMLLDKGLDHQVWILGEGPDRKKLQSLAKELNIENTCHFLGFKNPYPYLAAADIFVMTSDYEGLPVVICEAMILAKPIVSTDVTGPRELLENGRYGLLTQPQVASIVQGLEKMIREPQLRESYQKRLQSSVGSFIFSSDTHLIEEKFLEI